MFEYHLFLAFPLSPTYSSLLEGVPIALRSLFIQNQNGDYLREIEHEGKPYLGKSVGELIDLSALETAQTHILSLLKRLVPDFPYSSHPFILIALPKGEE